jgi:hypothetical protein
MSYADNQAAIQKLGNGELHGVSSCDIISEGFDVPVVTAAILLRPTQSLGLHLQQIGRVLRPAPGKERAIVIDHVGNVAHWRKKDWQINHGRAEDDRVWSLDGREKEKGEAPVRRCEACFAIIPAAVDVCPECGHEREQGVRRELEQLDGDLEELPQWLPTPQTGIRHHILEVIARKLDVDPFALAQDLIPQVPHNCYAQEKAHELRRFTVGALNCFIRSPTPTNWDIFAYDMTRLLKLITGALCAAAESLSDFQAIAELNGYKPGWAYFRHQQKLSHVRS